MCSPSRCLFFPPRTPLNANLNADDDLVPHLPVFQVPSDPYLMDSFGGCAPPSPHLRAVADRYKGAVEYFSEIPDFHYPHPRCFKSFHGKNWQTKLMNLGVCWGCIINPEGRRGTISICVYVYLINKEQLMTIVLEKSTRKLKSFIWIPYGEGGSVF